MSYKVNKKVFPELFDSKGLNENKLELCLHTGYDLLFVINESKTVTKQRELHKIKDDILIGLYENNQDTIHKIESLEKQILSLNLLGSQNQIRTDIKDTKTDIVMNLDQVKKQVCCIESITSKLFHIDNASIKGSITEGIVYKYLSSLPNYTYTRNNTQARSGDGLLVCSHTNLRVMVEIKNYKQTIPQKEIQKFMDDMANTGENYGIFISIGGKTTNRQIEFKLETINGIHRYCVFVWNVSNEFSRIESGLCVLESIHRSKLTNTLDQDFMTKVTNRININLNRLDDVIKDISIIRKKYLDVEKIVKKQLDEYYYVLRDKELDIKNKLDEILNKTMSEITSISDIESCKNEWDQIIAGSRNKKIMQRLSDLFSTNGFHPEIEKTNLIRLCKDNICLYKIQEMASKVDFKKDNKVIIVVCLMNIEIAMVAINSLLTIGKN